MSGGEHSGRLEGADIDWETGAPRSRRFGDIYFSGDGEAEAEHIFLAGNDLETRFRSARRFRIGELGFGTGLNFLKTWELWERTAPAGATLFYVTVEKFPLCEEDLARAHAAWPHLAARAARLRAVLPPPAAGLHCIEIAPRIVLMPALGEAGEILARLRSGIDAWYFDGFAPSKNPAMWSQEIFREAARLSAPGATFATFTVAGEARRALTAAGFAVEKRPGFGRKKEMLAGRIENPAPPAPRAPWFENARPRWLETGARIAVIGGGVAGASLAHAARNAGLIATIIEKDALAAGASGNPAGLIMPRLDLGEDAAARFFRLAYLHTVRLLKDLGAPFEQCGVLLCAKDKAERERQEKIFKARLLPESWIELRDEGLFFPQAGVVDPAKFVAVLAGGAETVRARAIRIAHEHEKPVVALENGERRDFDAVILANGVEALAFDAARTLPLAAIVGQVDFFPDAPSIAHAIACGAYAAPAPGGGLVIGATYQKRARGEEPVPSRAATAENIEVVAQFAPEAAAHLRAEASAPRASLRCQTPDRLPLVGPLPDVDYYGAVYDDLRLGVKSDYPPGEMLPDLYILSGLGSRGLVTAPFAAAQMIAGLAGAAVDVDIAEALHPARFFIRELKRARTMRKA
ncbi:MAG: bifunctional tRNA (5-methylaminomethyl-2-thiouridine)(34)-methyltransferase MnmD/FAD-dependent 5-carboxymethylaminomethyl-2-thiouridine(34) oxidoreductase MnmC [Alphaproteobacteria bacterium]|nr:bifunctional tRNA (5-methylaminomethyl-2-thiouridine)(34)-methyltransferase MnmD/FAD-dependent 5-carboxymethylaminomethyl-2-thiouridine(34) oxidoreductase MnmC [Alphaproteobacteria bacterium]